jgi:hypothetical protein
MPSEYKIALESPDDTMPTSPDRNSFDNISVTVAAAPDLNAPGLNMQDHHRLVNEVAALKPAGLLRGIANLFIGTASINTATPKDPKDSSNTIQETVAAEDSPTKTVHEIDNDELEREWEFVNNDDRDVKDEGWTLEADRQLCILWFFTTCSFTTIASILNYSAINPPMPKRIHGKETKKRFILLSTDSKYSRCYIYHEVKRLAAQKGIDWTPAIRAQDLTFSNAWKAMREVLEHQRFIGEERRFKSTRSGNIHSGYDRLSDKNCEKLGHPRLWSIDERKKLLGMTWKGLGTVGVARPTSIDKGYGTDVDVERAKVGLDIKAKKAGWFG